MNRYSINKTIKALPFEKVVVIIFFHICHGVVRNFSYFVKDVNNSIQSCVPDFIVFEVLVIRTSDLWSPITKWEARKFCFKSKVVIIMVVKITFQFRLKLPIFWSPSLTELATVLIWLLPDLQSLLSLKNLSDVESRKLEIDSTEKSPAIKPFLISWNI